MTSVRPMETFPSEVWGRRQFIQRTRLAATPPNASSRGVRAPFKARDKIADAEASVFPSDHTHSSSLAFTASLATFSVAGWPSGHSARDPSALFVKTAESVLPRLRGTFRAPLVHLDRSSPVRLSWDSFSVCAPPLTCLVCVHSPKMSPSPFGRPPPGARHVPFSRFLTTTTVCSALEVSGLLHPEAR